MTAASEKDPSDTVGVTDDDDDELVSVDDLDIGEKDQGPKGGAYYKGGD